VDRILIEALEIECIVGVRPLERRRKQVVRLDLALSLDLSGAGKTGRITDTVDYARIADEVSGLLRFREYQLIEVATEELAAMLFGVHPMLQALQIRLEKPEALRGRARSASVEIQRSRAEFPVEVSPHGCGEHELLLNTHEARLEIFRLAPEASWESTAGSSGRYLEWSVAGELTRDGSPLDRDPRERVTNVGSKYCNRGLSPAALFRCECLTPGGPTPVPDEIT
jgi:dihydroneopterin aldolase